MDAIEKMRKRMSYSGKNLRDSQTRQSRLLFESVFEDDPSYREKVYRWKLGMKPEDYTQQDLIPMRVSNRKYSEANGWTAEFHTKIDNPVVTGDVIYVADTNEYLLCTESFNIDFINWKGRFTLCNWMLKWQLKNGEVVEYPCYLFNATQYNSGERPTKLYTIGTSQYICKLPYDENTVKLKTPQRFFIDKDFEMPTPFVVTQNDNTSYNFGERGMIRITIFEDVLQSDDRIDLGICNYKEPEVIKEIDDSEVLTSNILFKTRIIKSGGTPKTFTAVFYDSDGQVVPDVLPKWSIVGIPKDVLEVNESGNDITISIDNDDYIDETFKLVLTDTNGEYSSEIIITIDSIL